MSIQSFIVPQADRRCHPLTATTTPGRWSPWTSSSSRFFDEALRVLLIRRGHDPFAGKWAIPGGFLEMDEPVEAGARRELKEETGLEIPGPIEPIGFFGEPGRDPRGRTITLAHAAVAPPGGHTDQGRRRRDRRRLDRGWMSLSTWRSTTTKILAEARALAESGDSSGETLLWLLLPQKFTAAGCSCTSSRRLAVPDDPVRSWLE